MTGAELKQWMDENLYSNVGLACAIGVSKQTVARWRAGRHHMRPVYEIVIRALPPRVRKFERMLSRAPLFIAYLREKYPTGVVPFGGLTEAAEQFGVSRERIRRIATKNGFRGSRAFTAEERAQRYSPVLCPDCGGVTGHARTLSAPPKVSRNRCEACRWTTLPCSFCGLPVTRRTGEYASHLRIAPARAARGLPHNTGRVFCNRVCFGRWCGRNYGWGSRAKKGAGV